MARLHHLPPSEQVYHSFVPSKYDGMPVEKYFSTRFTYLTEEEWVGLILENRITVNGRVAAPGQVLNAQDRVVTRMGVRREPPADRTLDIVYEDRNLRIFNKGAPIPAHPSGRYFKNSMTELLKEVYPHEIPRPVQRLDATTTGLIVFAKTREAAAFLMAEFQNNRVEKEYLALVEGRPEKQRFSIDAPIGVLRGSIRGAGWETESPKPAVTEIQWVSSLSDRSLLRVFPRSGRTNQIRVHLSSVGLPIVNDRIYGQGDSATGRYGLHAYRLRFRCFDSRVEVTSPCPNHFKPYFAAENRYEN